MRIDWFLYHVASGQAFFSGLGLIAAAVAVAAVADGKSRRHRAMPVLVLLGGLLVTVSATPLPPIGYAIGSAVLVLWAITESRRERLSRRNVVAARAALVATLVIAAGAELPYHVAPRLTPQPRASLAVIGDSVTAGIGENEAVTWPRLLAERHGVTIHDHSAMGATVATARKQAAKLRPEDMVVVLEIGGNDLLGRTSSPDFAAGLDALLRDVRRPGRAVVMFELPLPPTFNAYGRVQRRLAARHGVDLIPKRVLMGVLTGSGSTLDTIHLSQAGHDRMAEAVWEIVGPAFVSPLDTAPRKEEI